MRTPTGKVGIALLLVGIALVGDGYQTYTSVGIDEFLRECDPSYDPQCAQLQASHWFGLVKVILGSIVVLISILLFQTLRAERGLGRQERTRLPPLPPGQTNNPYATILPGLCSRCGAPKPEPLCTNCGAS